jgi:hypothetical protein
MAQWLLDGRGKNKVPEDLNSISGLLRKLSFKLIILME